MARTADVVRILEAEREEGRSEGRAIAIQEFYGDAAAQLLAYVFADAADSAASRIDPVNADAATMLRGLSQQLRRWATPPQVQSVEPPDQATDVAAGNPIEAHFTDLLLGDTVTGETVHINPASGGQALAATVVYDEASRSILLTPTNGLSPGVRYRVTIEPDLRAIGGQRLATAYEWQFETAP